MPSLNFPWPIIGHHKIVEFLQQSIVNDRVSHAYLFVGSKHLGKTSVAECFVSALLCRDNHNKPCNDCVSCKQFRKGVYPDAIWLARDKDQKNISIENVRELQSRLRQGTFLDSYKIAIIESADTLSLGAANALLKTLEEPTKRTVIILLASDLSRLLLTVVSRCQVLKFLPVAMADIENGLRQKGLTVDIARELAALSCGHPGIALELLDNEEKLDNYKKEAQRFLEVLDKRTEERFKLAAEAASASSGQELVQSLNNLLDVWSIVLRDLILIKNNASDLLVNIFAREKMISLSSRRQTVELAKGLARIKETKEYLSQNVNPKLAMETLLLGL